MRFPASWFVFCTEIPLFLSDFAETTIAPLPVLVTVTPLTLSLSSGVQLHRLWSGRGEFRAETWSMGESRTNMESEETTFCLIKHKFHGKKSVYSMSGCQNTGENIGSGCLHSNNMRFYHRHIVMGSVAKQRGHGNYNRTGHLSLREEGWMEGSKVRSSLHHCPNSVSCVFSTQIMLIIMLIIMLTLITIIFKGDITDFEIHLHLQMSWLHWRMVEPPGHGCSVELQAG